MIRNKLGAFLKLNAFRRHLLGFAFVATLLSLVSISQAGPLTVLTPGGAVTPNGANVPLGGGTVVAETLSAFSSPTGSFNATLTSIVYAGDTSNPYGGLDFIYQLSNSAASTDELDRLTLSSFNGFLTDVGYETPIPVGAVLPSKTTRSAAGVNGGSTIGWRFDPASNGVIDPGKGTVFMIIQTDAKNWQNTFASVQNSERADIPSYGPAPAIPEPTTFVLASIGLVALVLAGRQLRGR